MLNACILAQVDLELIREEATLDIILCCAKDQVRDMWVTVPAAYYSSCSCWWKSLSCEQLRIWLLNSSYNPLNTFFKNVFLIIRIYKNCSWWLSPQKRNSLHLSHSETNASLSWCMLEHSSSKNKVYDIIHMQFMQIKSLN